MKYAPITDVFSTAIERAIPASALTVSAWADAYRFLAPERAALPGRWRTDRVPYLRGVMDAVTRPDVREVVFMASSQVGKSEFCNNVIGYYVHIEPSPILYVCESELKARAWSTESLAPMIRDTPVLSALIEDPRERDSGNTIAGKKFAGGHLAIAWATSAAGLSSRPRRVVLLDEVDGFGTTNEGDPVTLAEARLKTFPDAKLIKVSSPRDKDTSRIEPAYEASFKGLFYVPCPHCDEFQTIEWERIKWDERPSEAYLVCVANGCVIEHEFKRAMLARGEWRHEGEFTGSIGFRIWEGYSPFVSWGEMAINFLKKKRKLDELKAFVNTSLGQSWEERETEIEIGQLPDRCEEYEAEVPADVLVLTAGVDVQGNRLEFEVVGWAEDHESWSIYYGQLIGDPAQNEVWEELKTELAREFIGVGNRRYRVECAAIDSGGHHTDEVYRFTYKNRGRRWFAVKGANTPGKPLVSKPTLQGKPPVKLFTLGTETAKDTFSNQLTIVEPGPNYCHFPALFNEQGEPIYNENYFKQLRSETAITKYDRGVSRRVWRKIRPSMRNEALDCRVYAMAALAILNPDFAALRRNVARSGRNLAENVENVQPQPVSQPKNTFVPKRLRRGGGGGGFVRGWR
jgi:phage terminase large subunit GpA-like protein